METMDSVMLRIRPLASSFGRYLGDSSGNFGIMFAVGTAAVMGMAGLALDYSRIQNSRVEMAAALDEQVLAWASPDKIQLLESAVQVTRSQLLGQLQLVRRQMGFNLPYSMNSRQRNTVVWFKEKLPKMEAALAKLDAAQ